MNLYIESDSQRSGKLIKAYRKNWNFSRNKGSYNTHRDFFSIHWELHAHSRNKVRLHVESPKNEDDSELNLIKLKLIIGIFSKIDKIFQTIKCGEINIGSKLLSADENKSTEVFKVVINGELDAEESNTVTIEKVDNEIGYLIDGVVNKITKELEAKGLKSTTI